MKHEAEFDAQLLDLHLNRLGEAERSALLERVAADAQLARQHTALQEVFAALNLVGAAAAPADLNARVAARVAAAPVLRVAPQPRRAVADDRIPMRRMFSLRDVIATAAGLVLMVGVGVPALLQVRERNQRIACSAQLAQLGQGLAMYGSTYADSLPFAGWGANRTWAPSDDPGVVTQPNRRHMYPLVRLQAVTPRAFICPSTSGVPMSERQVRQFDDFPDARNVSFAYQNMAGARPSLRDNPDMPILADDNPIFDSGRFLLSDLPRHLGLRKAEETNSRAHGGHGQNILTIGGRVKWTQTPNAGLGGDNIWTLNGVERYEGREGPRAATDSHLLK